MLRPRSIRSQLTLLMMAIAVVALVLTCAFLIGYQFFTARRALTRDLHSVADMISANTMAAVQFGDRRAAVEVLNALVVDPRVVSGTVCTTNTAGSSRVGLAVPTPGLAAWSPSSTTWCSTASASACWSSPAICASRTPRWKEYASLVLLVLLISAWIALALSLRLQGVISQPILALADKAGVVSRSRDYSLRAAPAGATEIRILCDRFNDMLGQVEERDRALREAHDELEDRVRERTRALEVEVAERRAAEEKLTVAKEAAEAANRAKSAFLANMSHELRTPLNAVIGYSEMLREDADEAGGGQAAEDLGKIEKAAKHLLALINDVLDISKIEAGRMTLTAEPFAVGDLVCDVVTTASGLATRNGNKLEVGPLDGIGTMVGDQTRVRQVLLNLLSNAAKFTDHGRIGLDVSTAGSNGATRIRFVVWDTGIGIPVDKQHTLFAEFVQVDASASRKYRRHGARAGDQPEAVPPDGRGHLAGQLAGQRVRLHGGPADAGRAGLTSGERRSAVSEAKPLLLVVDDDEMNRDMLGRRLERAGYQVVTAQDGPSALTTLDRVHPDLILLDIMMPGMSGLEVLRRIRSTPGGHHAQVVLVTAKAQSEDVVDGLEAGADDYITKPIDMAVALARIRTQLAKRKAELALSESEERYTLAVQGTNDGVWDWNLPTGRVYYSPRWKAIMGYGEDETPDTIESWLVRVHDDDLERVRLELDEHLRGVTRAPRGAAPHRAAATRTGGCSSAAWPSGTSPEGASAWPGR